MKKPKHYEGEVDWFDVCYAQKITDPCVIHAGSYLTRLGKKDGVTIAEDLRKAIYCLQRALARHEGGNQASCTIEDPENVARAFAEKSLADVRGMLSKYYQKGYFDGVKYFLENPKGVDIANPEGEAKRLTEMALSRDEIHTDYGAGFQNGIEHYLRENADNNYFEKGQYEQLIREMEKGKRVPCYVQYKRKKCVAEAFWKYGEYQISNNGFCYVSCELKSDFIEFCKQMEVEVL